MNVLQTAMRKVGQRLLRDFAEVENLQVSAKGPGDFVSQADLRAEQTLKEELHRAPPRWAFLGEEGGQGPGEWEWRWVVDPLDGTTNFLHGIPHWAISVGVERRLGPEKTELVAGCIYNPAANEMFWAEKGMGAFLNDSGCACPAGGRWCRPSSPPASPSPRCSASRNSRPPSPG
jgi:myo-inositol-1(or 4)-monophosphatase